LNPRTRVGMSKRLDLVTTDHQRTGRHEPWSCVYDRGHTCYKHMRIFWAIAAGGPQRPRMSFYREASKVKSLSKL
jgi:hypothetical protein